MKSVGIPLQYACFSCRKSFKRPRSAGAFNRFMTSEQQRGQQNEARRTEGSREYKCPDCGGPAAYMGQDFKAPKKSDRKAWEKAQAFIQSGKIFYRGSR